MTTTTDRATRYSVHAIVGGDHPGAAGEPVSAVAAAGLVAVVSDPDQRPVRLKAAMTQHLAILDALGEGGPVLPMAFGFEAAERSTIEADLEAGAARYRSLLDLVRGRRQYDLWVSYDEDAAMRAIVSGDRHLARLAARGSHPRASMQDRISLGEAVAVGMERRRGQDAADLAEALATVAAAVRVEAPGGRGDVHVATLAPPEAVDGLASAAESVIVDRPWVARVRVTGPSPAFSFMDTA